METSGHEQPQSPEEYTSRIVLSFLRHAEKETDASKTDEEIELTAQGKQQAIAQSQKGNLDVAVAFGSPRKRTQETAAFMMAGREENITGEESLEELRKKVDAELSMGTKIAIDERLNFNLDESKELGALEMEAFRKKEYLKFVVEQSDELARKLGDKENFTYSRGAGAVAGIVKKYLNIGPRW
ncbi:MAG: phosphoglycerate mutase family protein, partial [Patescibacteria group bacterium]